MALGPSKRSRQARGRRRIDQILQAAEEVIVSSGYEAATTNAIAARAGISPGSLYQFFANKDAIALSLADRYLEQLGKVREMAFGANLVALSPGELVDRVVDLFVSFNVANPAFQILFADASVPARVSSATRQLHMAVLDQVETMIAARAPRLAQSARHKHAQVSVQMFRALLPLVLSSKAAERKAFVAEMKRAIGGYLAQVMVQGPPPINSGR